MSDISTLDLVVIAGYFLLVFAIGIWVALKTKTGDDLFLGGRAMTWGIIGFSLFASNISSTTLIGLSGAAYTTGIAASNYEWMSGIPLMVMAAFFVPIYLRARITTVPEYLELRYDVRSRKTFSIITIVISVMVDMAGGLYAGAVVLQVFFPEIELWHTTLTLALIAGLYTAFGGLKAVVYTDTLQAIILITGGSILTYILFAELDFSWSRVVDSVPEGHLSVIKPMSDPTLPWLGTLVGVPLLGFWYWVTNQYVTQRVLAAKSVDHARWGALFGGALKLLPIFIMVLPGAMAVSVLPGIDNPDQVFPALVTQVLPIGVTGIVLAGLISAIMSSVDSTLNSASTLIVIDFIKPNKPNISPRQVAKYGRITTLIIMLVAASWAPMIADFGGLWSYLQQMFAIIVPPIAVIFLVGIFYPRAGGSAAFITLLSGFALGIVLFALRRGDLLPEWLHYTVGVGLMFAISTLIFLVAAHFTKPSEPDKVAELVYQPGMTAPTDRARGWRDYRLHCLLLTGAMLVLLITFW